VLRGYFPPTKTKVFRRLETALARSADALIAVSPEVRDDLVQLGVAPADNGAGSRSVCIPMDTPFDEAARLSNKTGAGEPR
jgi:hypothetical protein